MKTLIKLFAIALLFITVSCDKGDYQLVDVVHNQGESVVTVNGLVMHPGTRLEFPHTSEYTILTVGECKININGAIYYEPGVYQNESKRKSYK